MLKSSQTRRHQILGVISPAKAEGILKDLANVPGEWPFVDDPEGYKRMMSAIERIRSLHKSAFENCPIIATLVIRDFLRKAWTAPDARHAEWYLFRLRHLYAETVRRVRHVRSTSSKPDLEIPTIPGTEDEAVRYVRQSTPPPAAEIEAAAFYLQKNLRRALYCPNPACPAPYFFSKKKGQRYCSEACALPAQREAKRKWWNENRARSKRRR